MLFINNENFKRDFRVRSRIILKNEFKTNLFKRDKKNIIDSNFAIFVVKIIENIFANRHFREKNMIFVNILNKSFVIETKNFYNMKRSIHELYVLIIIDTN